MDDKVSEIVSKIKEGDSEAYIMLSDLIEKCYSENEYESEYNLVNQAEVGTDTICNIQNFLQNIIESDGNDSLKPQAVNLLGMIRNDDVYNYLLKTLYRCTNDLFEKYRILAQCVAAIGKRDHNIVSNNSFSSNEWKRNIDDSLKYLEIKKMEIRI